MPFSRRHIPKQISKHALATQTAFYGGTPAPPAPPPRAKPKVQRETREVGVLVKPLMREFRNVKLYRNTRGQGYYANGTPTKIGVGPRGFPDYLGYVSIVVTPEMVGSRVAIFAAPELKIEDSYLDKDQRDRRDEILAAGGIAGCVRNREDFVRVLKL